MHRSGIHDVFAITGDHPQAGKLKKSDLAPLSGYDLDSVQLVELIAELREAGYPFHISVAVSPFKYTEADCVYQYLKLEKKIAAGADFAITQLGYDSRKFRELQRYLAERGLKNFPVFGNVYVLSAPAARKFAKGEPPGCWVSEELRDRVQAEADASADKGMAARLERAAKMVAIVRGLGFAGAYLGGDHDAGRLKWIIERSVELAPRWEECAEEISYAPKSGFFYFENMPPPPPREFKVRVYDVLNSMALAHKPGLRRTVFGALMRWFDRTPSRAQALERAELKFKLDAFGCQACGNCVLGEMEYVCPMTCPKNLRNGPCGGPLNGMCEVTPEQPCIWVSVYQRAKARGRIEELRTYLPPRRRELANTSSYINFYLGRDSRPENKQPLIQITGAGAAVRK